MTDPFAPFRTDTLLLLVGGNPLPNYVASQLLLRQQDTPGHIVLIHSEGTNTARQQLERVLCAASWSQGKPNITPVLVRESDPPHIQQQTKEAAAQAQGSIGLNYTGGTKAMAVHAYLALNEHNRTPPPIFSYLDARALSMVFSHYASPVSINNQVQVSLETLLQLHGLDTGKQEMKRAVQPFQHTRNELAAVHQDAQRRKDWHNWCNQKLRKDNGKWKSKSDINNLTSDDLDDERVRQAMAPDRSAVSPPYLLKDLLAPLKDEKLAKWLQGDWMEEYVFVGMQSFSDELLLHDTAMTINPKVGETEFEFDVACMRGHQFFGLSVTSSADKSRCKSKLLEAIARTEQLGGAEARCALVCCVSTQDKRKLENETIGLPNHDHTRVFGADDLPTLATRLKEWIKKEARI